MYVTFPVIKRWWRILFCFLYWLFKCMMCLILSIREKSGNQKTKNVDCQVRVGATWSCQRGPSCSKTVYRLPEFKSTPRFLFVLLKKTLSTAHFKFSLSTNWSPSLKVEQKEYFAFHFVRPTNWIQNLRQSVLSVDQSGHQLIRTVKSCSGVCVS